MQAVTVDFTTITVHKKGEKIILFFSRKERYMTNLRKQYPACDKALDMLRLFGPLYREQLAKFMRKEGLEDAIEILERMAREKLISFALDGKDLYYSLYKDQQMDFSNAAAFELCVNLIKEDEESKIAKAKYPFDYLVQVDGTLYQVINTNKEGQFKLNFRKEMEKSNNLGHTVPVLMTLNQDEIDFMLSTEKGLINLEPEDDYILGSVRFFPENNGKKKFSVKKLSKEGEALNGQTG